MKKFIVSFLSQQLKKLGVDGASGGTGLGRWRGDKRNLKSAFSLKSCSLENGMVCVSMPQFSISVAPTV